MSNKSSTIRNLIIPLARYPHLNENKLLKDAIKVYESFQIENYSNLIFSFLLVVNDQNQVVGKLSLVDVMRGLAPRLLQETKVDQYEGKGAEFPNLAFLYEESTYAECGENQNKTLGSLIRTIDFHIPADTHLLKALLMMSHDTKYFFKP